jgi:hypothetical protein
MEVLLMKKLSFVMILALGIGLAGVASAGFWGGMMGSGMKGGGGYGYGPGSGMMGSGFGGSMMGFGNGNENGRGYTMGSGYGRNGNSGYGMPFYGGNHYGSSGRGSEMTRQEAEAIVGNYIGGNPNLRAGKIKDRSTYFETEIRTKDNSLVSKLAVDKNTGNVRQLY